MRAVPRDVPQQRNARPMLSRQGRREPQGQQAILLLVGVPSGSGQVSFVPSRPLRPPATMDATTEKVEVELHHPKGEKEALQNCREQAPTLTCRELLWSVVCGRQPKKAERKVW